MWWLWLVPSLVVAGALLAVALTGLEAWRGLARFRRLARAVAADAERAGEIAGSIGRRG
ncbi:MAG: hypothetical protein ACJ74O_03060 [Frankiaceae bacterium]